MTKTQLRKEEVLLWLADKEKLNVSSISNRFNISPATARRLCNELAKEGKVKRLHGSIEILDTPNKDYDFKKAMGIGHAEKHRIAEYIASMLNDGDSIFLETGTTTLKCAMAISEQIQKGKLKKLRVFTNFLPILDVLGNFCEVSLLGGVYHPAKKCLYGYLSEQALKNIRFDYSIIGCESISLERGIMTYDFDTIRFIDPLLAHSKHAVIVAHSDKFNHQSFVSFMACENAHVIVTDDGLSEKEAQAFLKKGIDLVRV
ncbi:MAG: DeoR/GlpR transcriptional regulator [Ruminococcaceae bacterium]|nr:DeoR/GlpR transcriptional regulator [Oscillospiraceae bacterium]